jgi:hypothetical protein
MIQLYIILILIILLIFIIKHQKNDMVYVISDIDNKPYMVRKLLDKQQASNMLAKLHNNIYIFVQYLMDKITYFPTVQRYIEFKPYIIQLNNKIQNVIIQETPANTEYTSYTINKGEQIIFCIRSSEPPNNIHDLNLIMYVLLHELSHVACPEYNHTPLFKKIFKFICEEAIEMGIYKSIDFNTTPQIYCGMKIYDSII